MKIKNYQDLETECLKAIDEGKYNKIQTLVIKNLKIALPNLERLKRATISYAQAKESAFDVNKSKETN